MTTSGTVAFNMNRDQIIKAALRKLGAIQAGETPDNQTIQDCSDQLNSMVKSLAATGLHIWTEAEATCFLNAGQITYSMGTGATDNITENYTATTTLSASSLGANQIAVTSATGFAASYNLVIVLDDGTIQSTTVSGNPVGTTITLANSLTDSVSAGNPIYVYQTRIVRPLRIVSARRYTFAGQLDTQMIGLSRIDYRNLPNKMNTGVVTQWFYDPRGGANATGKLHVWPAPSDSTSAVKFTWYRPLQDFTTSAQNPDLPQEWLDALVWNLALRMAPEYDCPLPRYQMIKDQAGTTLDNVSGWDREPESYLFGYNADQTQ